MTKPDPSDKVQIHLDPHTVRALNVAQRRTTHRDAYDHLRAAGETAASLAFSALLVTGIIYAILFLLDHMPDLP